MPQFFSDRLQSARMERGIELRELAYLVDIPNVRARMWERGENNFPRADHLEKIATFLNMDLRWLITGEGAANPEVAPLSSVALEVLMEAIAVQGFDVTIAHCPNRD